MQLLQTCVLLLGQEQLLLASLKKVGVLQEHAPFDNYSDPNGQVQTPLTYIFPGGQTHLPSDDIIFFELVEHKQSSVVALPIAV